MSNTKIVNWTVTIHQAEYILNCLATRPFGEVKELMDSLMDQANVRADLKAVETAQQEAIGAKAN